MNAMIDQIRSIPALIEEIVPRYAENIQNAVTADWISDVNQIFLTGCGDSYHVALGSELAFRQLAGVSTTPLTSMQFARYTADQLNRPEDCLVVGTSVSGEVSRTAEALRYARIAGAKTLAFTAAPASPVAQAAEIVVDSSQPAFDVPAGLIVPGIRSFTANQIAALLLALQIGKIRGRLTPDQYQKRKAELFALGAAADRCISRNLEKIETLAGDWLDERDSIFCGSGPNFGSALFSAAKMIEATGEMSAGQDLEEWAHLQYFSKHATTPTFILSAADRDKTRAKEIITAAIAIGRRVAVIAPEDAAPGNQAGTVHLSISAGFSEMFTPILMVIPGALYAAWRAEKLGEPYFRDFSGGRSREGGGGISRIRTSESPTDFFTAHKEF